MEVKKTSDLENVAMEGASQKAPSDPRDRSLLEMNARKPDKSPPRYS